MYAHIQSHTQTLTYTPCMMSPAQGVEKSLVKHTHTNDDIHTRHDT